jgi:hypothetical protein
MNRYLWPTLKRPLIIWPKFYVGQQWVAKPDSNMAKQYYELVLFTDWSEEKESPGYKVKYSDGTYGVVYLDELEKFYEPL